MMIGSFSGIPYRYFAGHLAPVAGIGLALTVIVIRLMHAKEFSEAAQVEVVKKSVRIDRWLMWKSILVALAMIVMFFAGWPVPKVAVVAGAVLLITRRVDPEKVYGSIDWGLLVMFAGLFMVIAGVEKTPFASDVAALAARAHLENVFMLSAFSAVLANMVSNVPAVLVF